jgi:hypothetical protein
MNEQFRNLIDTLHAKYEAILAMRSVIAREIPNDTPEGGVYLFSEGATHFYAGRTKRRLVELDICSIKVQLGMDVLRCKTAEMVRREMGTCLLAYNLIRQSMLEAALLANRSHEAWLTQGQRHNSISGMGQCHSLPPPFFPSLHANLHPRRVRLTLGRSRGESVEKRGQVNLRARRGG